jgi:hypothetical protein
VGGVYQFELTVTDNGGLSAKDTVQIIVDNLRLINHPLPMQDQIKLSSYQPIRCYWMEVNQ